VIATEVLVIMINTSSGSLTNVIDIGYYYFHKVKGQECFNVSIISCGLEYEECFYSVTCVLLKFLFFFPPSICHFILNSGANSIFQEVGHFLASNPS